MPRQGRIDAPGVLHHVIVVVSGVGRYSAIIRIWAVPGPGVPGTVVGKRMGIVQSALSKAVERGADLAAEHHFRIEDSRNR